MDKLSLIIILSALTISTLGQGLYEIDQNFKLFSSGKQKVSIYEDSTLILIKIIDSTNRIIIEHTVENSIYSGNRYSPIFDKRFLISKIEKFYFDRNGSIDSSLTIKFTSPLMTISGNAIPPEVDTTLITYKKTLLTNKILTRNFHSIKNGIREIYRTDHYGYDINDRLVLLIEDDGHTQYYFEYDNTVNILAYYVHKAKVLFDYDEFGRKVKDTYRSSTNTYEYDHSGLLIRKTTRGKNEGTLTLIYE